MKFRVVEATPPEADPDSDQKAAASSSSSSAYGRHLTIEETLNVILPGGT